MKKMSFLFLCLSKMVFAGACDSNHINELVNKYWESRVSVQAIKLVSTKSDATYVDLKNETNVNVTGTNETIFTYNVDAIFYPVKELAYRYTVQVICTVNDQGSASAQIIQ